MPAPAMAGLYPASAGGFCIEVEAAAASPAAVVRTLAVEGRLRTPGEGLLLRGKGLEVADDFLNGACMGRLHGFADLRVMPDQRSVNAGAK
jgi:hypothetical protein